MSITITGSVVDGFGVAGQNLAPVLQLIEVRSGLAPLIPKTLNVRLSHPFSVSPDFVVSRAEYNDLEEIRFRHCRLAGMRCLIMRPDSQEAGYAHGPAHVEIMSTVWLRSELGLSNGGSVTIEVL